RYTTLGAQHRIEPSPKDLSLIENDSICRAIVPRRCPSPAGDALSGPDESPHGQNCGEPPTEVLWTVRNPNERGARSAAILAPVLNIAMRRGLPGRFHSDLLKPPNNSASTRRMQGICTALQDKAYAMHTRAHLSLRPRDDQ
ncbi:MAG: hypothetical protein ACTSYL_09465, partial [Candidatus Thorarchaeota archaeon]